ncbi:MAG: hypothetical protein FJ390_05215 [Verrucomicrobia bacterium]|nr:hypothetical protein [Verrucomicrobiota bacterium]
MEDIPSSPEIDMTDSVSSQASMEPSREIPLVGELEGLKITEAEHVKSFSSLTSHAVEGENSLEERCEMPLHPFVQVHPSMTSLATESTSTLNPSPPLSQDQPVDLKSIEGRSSLLTEKIRAAEEVLYSDSQQGYRKFNENQQRYVKNLQSILKIIDDLATCEQEGDVIAKIESGVDAMIRVTEDLKKYHDGMIANAVSGKEQPYTGAAGEGTESLLHYLDYVQELKRGNYGRALIDFCLAKKCFAKFKSIEARQSGCQEEEKLFSNAFLCYSEALEENSFGDETLEEGGDSFFSAADMLHKNEQGLSRLYEEAAICFKRANQTCKSRVELEVFRHRQASTYWALSGNNTLNAIHTLQSKKIAVFECYNKARKCFQDVAEKLPLADRDSKILNEIQALDRAGNHFASATEALEANELKLASLHRDLGSCSCSLAEAFSKEKSQALNYLIKAERELADSLQSLQENKMPSHELYQFLGKADYLAGAALLAGSKVVATLYIKARQVREEAHQYSENRRLQDVKISVKGLKKAAEYYLKAGSELEMQRKESSKLYELAGNCRYNATKSLDSDAIEQWKQAAECYLGPVRKR